MIKQTEKLIVLGFALFVVLISCKKEKDILKDSSNKLEFSTDSILFDTVFTQVGSTTSIFTVKNKHNKPITISSIRLGRGTSSFFRLNVDGISANTFSNIEIPKNDSIFVFVEVTVDPTNQNNPLVIRDSIVFEVNQNIQDVKLEAWGQDAYFHVPDRYIQIGESALPYSIITCNDTWVNDKPHVIYGYAVVDSDCKLNISEGANIHLHNGAVLWVYENGTLEVLGSHTNPVTFQGDRLENQYKEFPGQWGKIWLSPGSKNNKIDWAIIKNGNIGVHLDTLGNSSNPTLTLSNTIIKNMSVAAFYAQGSFVESYNCVFANTGDYNTLLNIGGRYRFTHCTFANYWTNTTRQNPLLVINNWYEDTNGIKHPRGLDSAFFRNCIVYGSLENEIGLDSALNAPFNFKFDHCLIKTNLNTSNSFHYIQNTINQEPLFKNSAQNNYNLTSSSAAINKGNVFFGNFIPTDLNNKPRNTDIAPDLGAYELE